MPMWWWYRSRRRRTCWRNASRCGPPAATAGALSGSTARSRMPRPRPMSPSSMSPAPNITRASSCGSSRARSGTTRRSEVTVVATIDQLEAIYGFPNDASAVKVAARVTPSYRALMDQSPFAALATSGPEGLDCSPRGDLAGFVRVHDDKTLMMPDRRGNNRIDSLRNILRDPRIPLLFLIPGSGTTLRINGRAHLSVDPDLLSSFKMEGKAPRTVIVMTIEEMYFQCARAIVRA